MDNKQASVESGNNNAYPPDWIEEYRGATAFSQLDDASREKFLRDKGYLFGVRIDRCDGPRQGTRQVARYTSTLPPLIQETNNIDSEVTTTENSRDTNYVHKGWALSALSDISPWTTSRIARNSHQVNLSSRSITKYVMIQKLRIDISPKDLSPVPELERDFREALSRPTQSEKSSAVYQILDRWGDVIPLVFDIGISLTVTDSESAAKNDLADRSYLGLQKLLMSVTARPSTRGGNPATLHSEDNIRAWVSDPVPLSQWEQVRVVKAAPLTAILDDELQSQLAKLHRSLITYLPITTNAITSSGTSFDGISYAFNTISKIAVNSHGHHIKSISITYLISQSPIRYGVERQTNNEFELLRGEHITDVLLWKDHHGVCAIQLGTSQGRSSKHFGSGGGSPEVLRSTGGCLSGFAGIVRDGIIHDLQTIWRHDVQASGLTSDRGFSQYLGSMGGAPFNDWPFVKNSDSIHIGNIRIKCGHVVDGIQVTYRDFDSGGNESIYQAHYHGGSGGAERIFNLEPNEHIVTVTGRRGGRVDQLRFMTNKGRSSEWFGGGGGEPFTCKAPKTRDGRATRLHYICGKSWDVLDGILFVWAPL